MHQVYASVTAAASIYSASSNQFQRALSDAPTIFSKIIRSTVEAALLSSVKRERLKKSEWSDQGAWFQSQRAPGQDPLCYRSDSNLIKNILL